MLGALLLQVASNLANDVFDYEQGKDTSERLGPIRVVQAKLLTAKEVRIGLAVVIAASLLDGSYLVGKAGWPLVVVGLASILAALAYTAGPYPLGYHGLGDLFVFIFFGLIAVIGTQYVQCEWVSTQAIWASIPVGLLTTNILVVNNLRDRVEDARTGKRTLVVRFGKHFAMYQAAANLAVSYGTLIYFCWQTHQPWPILLPGLTLPLAIRWYREIGRTEGPAMNALLARAAQLLILFAALFSISLVVSS
jgi:1,4-dihydroxy-2-naphthoate octaprenyltransferase